MRRFAAHSLLLCSLACKGGGPQTVPVPAGDPTSPTLKLIVQVPGHAHMQTQPGSPPASDYVNKFDDVSMTAVAEDQESGVSSVAIWYDGKKVVDDPATGPGAEFALPGLPNSPRASSPQSPEPRQVGENAVVSRSVIYHLEMSKQPTGPNTRLFYEVWATAENYRGRKVTTSRIKLRYPGP